MGWVTVRLGEVCDVIAGQSPEGKYYNTHSDGLPFYQGKKEFGDKFISQPSSWTSKVTKVAIVGDILMSVRAPVGPINFSTQKCCIGRGLAAIRASDSVNKDFLFYSLLSKQDVIKGNEGAVFSSINKTQIGQLEIPLPPIPEQQRIVAILDQAFADIEKARANAEKNLKNARELFDSYLNQVFSQRGEDWVEKSLGEIADFKNGLNFSQSSKGEVLKIVGVKDFKSNFKVPFDQLDTIQIDGNLPSSYELKENDIITVRSNGNKRLIGRCLLVGPVNGKTSFSGFTIRIRIISPKLDSEFLAYYLKSATTHEMLINAGDGANISNLNQKILTSLPVAWPSIEFQLELVSNIKKIEIESSMLQIVYEDKLEALDELKKSLLQKAFSGELTKAEGHAA